MSVDSSCQLLVFSGPRALEHDIVDALRAVLDGDEVVTVLHEAHAGPSVPLLTPMERVAARGRAFRIEVVAAATRAPVLTAAAAAQARGQLRFWSVPLSAGGVL